MTKAEEEKIARWLNGDIYLRDGLGEGINSKDTEYDKMVEVYDPWTYQDSVWLDESPKDPYEYYRSRGILDAATDCTTSIGGVDGMNFDGAGTWRRNCKMFYPIP